MSQLRAVLDRINDVEATIARITREATPDTALALRLTLQSLENRREDFRRELAELTRHEFVEICDYRLVPDILGTYVLSAVTTALHEFQEIFSIVFDAVTDKPKRRAVYSPDVVEKTRFNFGFAYEGSLGVALTIKNNRGLFDAELDQAINGVFSLLKARSAESIKAAETLYGPPAIRKLYSWSKAHRDYGLSADIKWVRDSETRNSVLTQTQEFTEICKVIESKSEETITTVPLIGTLASWNTINRRFILIVPDAEPISGVIGNDVDITKPQTVRGERVQAVVQKHTQVSYVAEKEDVLWVLTELKELK